MKSGCPIKGKWADGPWWGGLADIQCFISAHFFCCFQGFANTGFDGSDDKNSEAKRMMGLKLVRRRAAPAAVALLQNGNRRDLSDP